MKQRHSITAMIAVHTRPETIEREPHSIRATTAKKPIAQMMPLITLRVIMMFQRILESMLSDIELIRSRIAFLRVFAM